MEDDVICLLRSQTGRYLKSNRHGALLGYLEPRRATKDFLNVNMDFREMISVGFRNTRGLARLAHIDHKTRKIQNLRCQYLSGTLLSKLQII